MGKCRFLSPNTPQLCHWQSVHSIYFISRSLWLLSQWQHVLVKCQLHNWLIEQATSHQTHYRSYRRRVFTDQMTQPKLSKHWRKVPNMLQNHYDIYTVMSTSYKPQNHTIHNHLMLACGTCLDNDANLQMFAWLHPYKKTEWQLVGYHTGKSYSKRCYIWRHHATLNYSIPCELQFNLKWTWLITGPKR